MSEGLHYYVEHDGSVYWFDSWHHALNFVTQCYDEDSVKLAKIIIGYDPKA